MKLHFTLALALLLALLELPPAQAQDSEEAEEGEEAQAEEEEEEAEEEEGGEEEGGEEEGGEEEGEVQEFIEDDSELVLDTPLAVYLATIHTPMDTNGDKHVNAYEYIDFYIRTQRKTGWQDGLKFHSMGGSPIGRLEFDDLPDEDENTKKKYTAKEMRQRQEDFTLCDEDGDGFLDKEEMGGFSSRSCMGIQVSRTDTVLKIADKDKDGKLTKEELQAFLNSEHKFVDPSETDAEKHFQVADFDQDGFLNKTEVHWNFGKQGLTLLKSYIVLFQMPCDDDKDMFLSKKELVNCAPKILAAAKYPEMFQGLMGEFAEKYEDQLSKYDKLKTFVPEMEKKREEERKAHKKKQEEEAAAEAQAALEDAEKVDL